MSDEQGVKLEFLPGVENPIDELKSSDVISKFCNASSDLMDLFTANVTDRDYVTVEAREEMMDIIEPFLSELMRFCNERSNKNQRDVFIQATAMLYAVSETLYSNEGRRQTRRVR